MTEKDKNHIFYRQVGVAMIAKQLVDISDKEIRNSFTKHLVETSKLLGYETF